MSENVKRVKNWRDYQRRHRRAAWREFLSKRLPWFGLWGVGCLLILGITLHTGSWISATLQQPATQPQEAEREEEKGPTRLTRGDLPSFLKDTGFDLQPLSASFPVTRNGASLTIETSLLPDLQNYVGGLLVRSHTVRAAVVVLKPDTGEILAIANFENGGTGANGNLCLKADYPAASLFKIVAAAAVMEARGFTPESTLTFRGRKHTLYQSQLKQEQGRSAKNATKITLKKAFSGSINPVFGKIGIHELGREVTAEYAERFLFNHPIPFDLPLEVSRTEIPADDFGLAETASGFNKRTMISPLHAALLSAAVANRGTMMEPWLIKGIRDGDGQTLYEAEPSKLAAPIMEQTAEKMKALMDETVVTGTCRNAFQPLQRKRVFRHIELGAKTGTINDASDQHRVDWVTAYAIPEGGGSGVCIATLAIHGEKQGIRAKDIARSIIDYYFSSWGL